MAPATATAAAATASAEGRSPVATARPNVITDPDASSGEATLISPTDIARKKHVALIAPHVPAALARAIPVTEAVPRESAAIVVAPARPDSWAITTTAMTGTRRATIPPTKSQIPQAALAHSARVTAAT